MRRLGRVVGVTTAKDLVIAAKDILTHNRLSVDETQARLDICKTCPSFNGSRCRECGCFMKTKTNLRSSTCPLDKWPKLSTHPAIDHTSHGESGE